MVTQDKARSIVGAVIVIYFPEAPIVSRQLRALAPQVSHIVIVDNGASEEIRALLRRSMLENSALQVLTQSANVGVATAHNIGAAALISKGCDYVLLLDQDSIPASDMVATLLRCCLALESAGKAVAAVGPTYSDPLTGHRSFFIRFGLLKFKRIYCDPNDNHPPAIPADFLISSGCLIPVGALEQVGGMDDRLFIDHVDTEWFLRAAAQGFRAYGICHARMEHSLGKGPALRIWLGRWRQIPLHSPLRHYYTFRNSMLLYRRSYAPWRWIFADLLRLIVLFVFFLTAPPNRREHGRMMVKGLRDGLRQNPDADGVKPP